MRASLPMYDLPEIRHATDAWWDGLAHHFRAAGVKAVPDRLTRDPAPDWTDPDLLFSQTCGYPLTHKLEGRVRLVCTPAYAAPGCDGVRYRSALIVAADSDVQTLAELRGRGCAINSRNSHSGCNVLRYMLAPISGNERFFESVIETGTHTASLAAVAAGKADICAVDAVTHALLARHAPDRLAGTRVFELSPPAPGLPYIASFRVGQLELGRMRAAIRSALEDPGLASTRNALLIDGAEVLSLEVYEEIVAMEREAVAMGYPELR